MKGKPPWMVWMVCWTLAGVLGGGSAALAGPLEEWDSLHRNIRDQTISRDEARSRIVALNGLIGGAHPAGGKMNERVFPVRGGGPRDIGGVRGNGFLASSYNFYHGNLSTGHPAHDIFVRDADQDGLRDGASEPVEILNFARGVVVGVNAEWDEGSPIRGGKYVWVFSPSLQRYCYYAHLEEVHVKLGDALDAGACIGILGRTGKNAFQKRSPTHLHFMCLSFDGGRMTPLDTYRELLSAERK